MLHHFLQFLLKGLLLLFSVSRSRHSEKSLNGNVASSCFQLRTYFLPRRGLNLWYLETGEKYFISEWDKFQSISSKGTQPRYNSALRSSRHYGRNKTTYILLLKQKFLLFLHSMHGRVSFIIAIRKMCSRFSQKWRYEK